MATISIRVDDELKGRAEEVADAEGMSVSEWARMLMGSALGYESPAVSGPPSLSKRDRHQLVLLHQLLRLASEDPYEVEYHETRVEVLKNGYAAEFSDEFADIYDELPIEECRLVWDILEMFRAIEWGLDDHGPEAMEKLPDGAAHALRFAGFDFNDGRELALAGYARFVISQDRWASMAPYFDQEQGFGNSHAPMLDHYLRMLTVFRPIYDSMVHGPSRGKRVLSYEDLRALVLVVYPEG